jgi:lipopolysaccharide export system permease protein
MKTILYRSILREIGTPLVLGLMAFTAVLLMGRLVKLTDLVIAKGVPLTDVLKLVGYLLPSFATVTIPMALLLAVLLAFGRLSGDSETTAMKACGISLYDMLPPVMVMALLAALATAVITLKFLPMANVSFRRMLHDIVESRANLAVKEKVFNDSFPNLTVYTDTFDDRTHTMGGVIINDERDSTSPLTIFARQGTIASDPDKQSIIIRLEDGTIHQRMDSAGYRLVSFGSYLLSIDLQKTRNFQVSKEDQLSLDELRRGIVSADLPDKGRRLMALEYHRRFALPAACLVFALVGVPLGLQNRRSGKSGGFALALGVIIAYFVVLSAGENLGGQGDISPLLAAWLPNGLFLVFGAVALWITATERTLPLADRAGRLLMQANAGLRRWRRP